MQSLMNTYQDSHLSENIQTWIIGTCGDSILFVGIILQGTWVGLRGQNLVHFIHKYDLSVLHEYI